MPNPWLPDEWNLTAQGQYVVQHGLEAAHKAAQAAGTTLNGRPRRTEHEPIIKNFILTKRITQIIGGKGYTGDGPPGEDV